MTKPVKKKSAKRRTVGCLDRQLRTIPTRRQRMTSGPSVIQGSIERRDYGHKTTGGTTSTARNERRNGNADGLETDRGKRVTDVQAHARGSGQNKRHQHHGTKPFLSQEAYGVLLLPLHSNRIDCCLSLSCVERSILVREQRRIVWTSLLFWIVLLIASAHAWTRR